MQTTSHYLTYILVKLPRILKTAMVCSAFVFSYNTAVIAQQVEGGEISAETAKGLAKLWEVRDEALHVLTSNHENGVYLELDGLAILQEDLRNYLDNVDSVCRKFAPRNKSLLPSDDNDTGLVKKITFIKFKPKNIGQLSSAIELNFLNGAYADCVNAILREQGHKDLATVEGSKDLVKPEAYSFPEETARIDGLVGGSDCTVDITGLQDKVFTTAADFNAALANYQEALIQTIESGVEDIRLNPQRLTLNELYQFMINASLDLQSATNKYNAEYKRACKDNEAVIQKAAETAEVQGLEDNIKSKESQNNTSLPQLEVEIGDVEREINTIDAKVKRIDSDIRSMDSTQEEADFAKKMIADLHLKGSALTKEEQESVKYWKAILLIKYNPDYKKYKSQLKSERNELVSQKIPLLKKKDDLVAEYIKAEELLDENENKEATPATSGGAVIEQSGFYEGDDNWHFALDFAAGVAGYDGVATGVNNAVNNIVSNGIPPSSITSSAEDTSYLLGIGLGAWKNIGRGAIGFNLFFRDLGEMKGSFNTPGLSVEGTENIKYYGANVGYRQRFSNQNWYWGVKGGYAWIKDDFSGTSFTQSGGVRTPVGQVSTSADDNSFIGGAGIGYTFSKHNAIELSIESTFSGVLEENERLDVVTIHYSFTF